MTIFPKQTRAEMKAFIAHQIKLLKDPDWDAGVIASNVNLGNPSLKVFTPDGLIPPGDKPAKVFLKQIKENEDETQLQVVVDEIAKRLNAPFENWLVEFRRR